MPTIKDFGGFRIYMYFGDHNPPHIHVIGPDFSAKMRLGDAGVFAGTLPGKVEKLASAYVLVHATELDDLWDKYNG